MVRCNEKIYMNLFHFRKWKIFTTWKIRCFHFTKNIGLKVFANDKFYDVFTKNLKTTIYITSILFLYMYYLQRSQNVVFVKQQILIGNWWNTKTQSMSTYWNHSKFNNDQHYIQTQDGKSVRTTLNPFTTISK